MSLRGPLLNEITIADLRPTQMTVGFREAAYKRRQWAAMAEEGRPTFLARHMRPVLLGPKKKSFAVDHRHLARALLDERCRTVQVNVIADLSMLDRDAFWVFVLPHPEIFHTS